MARASAGVSLTNAPPTIDLTGQSARAVRATKLFLLAARLGTVGVNLANHLGHNG